MNDLTEFERLRLEASTDNTKHTPQDVLRFALDDLRDTPNAYDACFIVLIKKGVPGNEEAHTARYRSGLRKIEELAYLQLMHAYALDEWKR